jgi:hypothetical protein
MWTAASVKWSAVLPSEQRLTDQGLRSLGKVPYLKPPESRRALPGLITRFARQIARFSARLLSG